MLFGIGARCSYFARQVSPLDGFVVQSHMKYTRGPDFSSVLVRMGYIPLGGGQEGDYLEDIEGS